MFPFVVLVASFIARAYAADGNHKFAQGDPIPVLAARVGPIQNPLEAYDFYDLPYCRPENVSVSASGLASWFGDALQGCDMVDTGIQLEFQVHETAANVCTMPMSDADKRLLQRAVLHRWVFTLYVDDMPIRGMVGPALASKSSELYNFSVFSRFAFEIEVNEGQIVGAALQMLEPVLLSNASLALRYDVNWRPSSTPFVQRHLKGLESGFFGSRVHWFALANSFAIVILMVSTVANIVRRSLSADYEKYAAVAKETDDDVDLAELVAAESGWKKISADVFRKPPHVELLCALVGAGNQLVLLALGFIVATISGNMYVTPGLLYTAVLFSYSATSFSCGYHAVGILCRMTGSDKLFRATTLLAALIVPGTALALIGSANFLALVTGSQIGVPVRRIFAAMLFWGFFCLPFCSVGAGTAQRIFSRAQPPPCNPIPRPIAHARASAVRMAMTAAVMPFGCIVIELYFILTSFWGLKTYYVFDLLLIVLMLLIAVTASSSVVCTYYLLSAEDYRWHWTSWSTGAFTGLYVLLYTLWFYTFNTNITGLGQTAMFLAFSTFFSCLIALGCGSISYAAASVFVRVMFKNIKND